MPDPVLTTPAAPSDKQCVECGSTLIRTGKPTTFSEGKRRKEFRGWVPSLLVLICPTCDSRGETPETAPVESEPASATAAESYLERLGREHDEREAKEGET